MISYASDPESPVMEIRISGKVTDAELEASMERARADIEENGKTRILEIIEDFHGMEPAAFVTDVRLGVPLARKVKRVAVVADQGWIRGLSRAGSFFTRADLKVFTPDRLAEARSWVRSD